MSIKVVHINYSDSKGGAAIAMNRIHNAQKKSDIESKINAFAFKIKSHFLWPEILPRKITFFDNANSLIFNFTSLR